ncbi:CDP-glucose 4,6-dehydratase, partial [Flavobacteriaceae bacterium]|nr:CDP-glucose 4,6-dehydratase [Flavobacteriaceae bacterium]
MELKDILNSYKEKKVLITGHTGFKGSWLSYWLKEIGAEVFGYSLMPVKKLNHFDLLKMELKSCYNNICNLISLKEFINKTNPEIIFHLAAQPLVRQSYIDPVETYKTNVIGTANLLEAIRGNPSVKAVIVITTDKCYKNLNQTHGYVESDTLGGYDPYSSSKASVELLVSSFRDSFFNLSEYGIKHQVLISTARAGNIIGGGDWSDDRLIPDLVKNAINGGTTKIRYPGATRPWQHVLDPLSGYLMLGEKLLNGETKFTGAWNFGPEEYDILSVHELVIKCKKIWNNINFEIQNDQNELHEANLLSLNINKAKNFLNWKPKW